MIVLWWLQLSIGWPFVVVVLNLLALWAVRWLQSNSALLSHVLVWFSVICNSIASAQQKQKRKKQQQQPFHFYSCFWLIAFMGLSLYPFKSDFPVKYHFSRVVPLLYVQISKISKISKMRSGRRDFCDAFDDFRVQRNNFSKGSCRSPLSSDDERENDENIHPFQQKVRSGKASQLTRKAAANQLLNKGQVSSTIIRWVCFFNLKWKSEINRTRCLIVLLRREDQEDSSEYEEDDENFIHPVSKPKIRTKPKPVIKVKQSISANKTLDDKEAEAALAHHRKMFRALDEQQLEVVSSSEYEGILASLRHLQIADAVEELRSIPSMRKDRSRARRLSKLGRIAGRRVSIMPTAVSAPVLPVVGEEEDVAAYEQVRYKNTYRINTSATSKTSVFRSTSIPKDVVSVVLHSGFVDTVSLSTNLRVVSKLWKELCTV
jgi:hypothetical protein